MRFNQPRSLSTRGNYDDYPALFLGSRSTTRLLTRIASEEPVPATDLIDNQLSSISTYRAIRHAERSGILIAFSQITGSNKSKVQKYLCLNHGLQINREIADTLSTIALTTGASERLDNASLVSQENRLTAAFELDLDSLFGSRTRTMAVIIVALARFLDFSTIARMVGVQLNGNLHSLLTPLVRGRVLQKRACGRLVLYALADEPWRVPLRRLCLRLAEISPRLTTLARLAEEIRDSGDSPPRKYLRDLKPSLLREFE